MNFNKLNCWATVGGTTLAAYLLGFWWALAFYTAAQLSWAAFFRISGLTLTDL